MASVVITKEMLGACADPAPADRLAARVDLVGIECVMTDMAMIDDFVDHVMSCQPCTRRAVIGMLSIAADRPLMSLEEARRFGMSP